MTTRALVALAATGYAPASLAQTVTLPALTFEAGVYTIFDQSRGEHVFTVNEQGVFTGQANSSGNLQQTKNRQYQWTAASGKRYQFTIVGSDGGESLMPASTLPVDDAESLSSTASIAASQRSDFECTDENTTSPIEAPIETPIEPGVEPDVEPESASEDDIEEQCDVETDGEHAFQDYLNTGPHTTLDARPQSCQSYFVEYYGTFRGSEIESGLETHSPYSEMISTIRIFPVIDFIDHDTLYVVNSRDLASQTFDSDANPTALLDQLMADGEDIQTRFIDVLLEEGSISATELGNTTTIHADDLRPVTLQLVIRDGMATHSHWQQIAVAREQLARQYGITLEVIVIP